MNNFLSKNLEFLRKEKKLSKLEAASILNVGRSTYYGYESGDSYPTFSGLIQIADYFGLSLSELVENNLSKTHLIDKNDTSKTLKKHTPNSTPIYTPNSENQRILAVNEGLGVYTTHPKSNVFDFETPAAAGPAITLLANDKYREVPTLYMPWLGPGIHVRTRIDGDSMHSTIKDGDKAVSTLVTDVKDIRQGYIYMFMDKEDGICYKRLYLDGKNNFELVPDNEIYKPYKRHFNDIYAIFRVREVHTTDLRPYWNDLRAEIRDIRTEMADFKRLLKGK